MSAEQSILDDRSSIINSIEVQLKRLSIELRHEDLERLDTQLREVPDDFASPELIGFIVHLCVLWLHAGEAPRALPVSEKAIRWATMLSDNASLRRAFNARASIATDMLDIGTSMSNFMQALEVAQASNDLVGIVTSYHNISVACLYVSMKRLAREFATVGIRILRDRSQELRPDDVQLYESILEHALAHAHLGMGDLRNAIKALRSVQRRSEQILPRMIERDRLQLASYLHQARCSELTAAIQLGMLDEARRLAALIQSVPDSAMTPKTSLLTRRALAELSAAEGRIQEAILELEEIRLDQSAKHEWPTIGHSLADCYKKVGRHSDAIAALRQMDVDVRLARSVVAVDKLRSLSLRHDEPDHSFERDLVHSATRVDIAREAIKTDQVSKFASLIAMSISAELDETDQLDGIWHPIRVGALARLVARASGADETTCRQAEVAGWLHDLGKCAIPDHLKLKSGPLSNEERQLLREHSEFGARLLDAFGDSSFEPAVAAIRHHHESYDGTGYPDGLAAKGIPFLGRVTALCDSFDAMMLSRPFRPAKSLPEALREIEACAGSKFDPDLATILVQTVRQLESRKGGALRQLVSLGKSTAPVESFERLEMLLKSVN